MKFVAQQMGSTVQYPILLLNYPTEDAKHSRHKNAHATHVIPQLP